MATAAKKSQSADHFGSRGDAAAPKAMEFVIFADNGGAYRWRLVAGDAAILAQSGRYASYGSAEQGARLVRDGAATARFDRRSGGVGPIELATRRERPSDQLDAERRSGEGDSFGNEAVATWPAPR